MVACEVKSLANQTGEGHRGDRRADRRIQGATADRRGDPRHRRDDPPDERDRHLHRIGGGGAGCGHARDRDQCAAGGAGTQEISTNIEGVKPAASDTGAAAAQVLEAAGELSKQAETLTGEVDRFVDAVRAA